MSRSSQLQIRGKFARRRGNNDSRGAAISRPKLTKGSQRKAGSPSFMVIGLLLQGGGQAGDGDQQERFDFIKAPFPSAPADR